MQRFKKKENSKALPINEVFRLLGHGERIIDNRGYVYKCFEDVLKRYSPKGLPFDTPGFDTTDEYWEAEEEHIAVDPYTLETYDLTRGMVRDKTWPARVFTTKVSVSAGGISIDSVNELHARLEYSWYDAKYELEWLMPTGEVAPFGAINK